jgi:hypothetical protein
MKTILQISKKGIWFVACYLLTNFGATFAQTEITVDGGFNTLYNAVLDNPGATLILKRGESYVIDQPLVINVSTLIMGETEPAATAPAVISFYADPGLAKNQSLFKIGADLTLKNIGMSGFTFDDQQILQLFGITARGVHFTLDGCITQGADWVMNTNGNNGLTITHKNNIFFNGCTWDFDNYGGYGCIWGGDSITYTSENNTWFVYGRIFNCAYIGPHALEVMNHNTYANIWGELFYPSLSDGFVAKNNIMFNPDIRGYVGKRDFIIAPGDTVKYSGDFSDFTSSNPRDSLQGDIGLFPSIGDIDNTLRNVVVANNLRYTEEKVKENQALATACLQPLMNDSVKITFQKFGWIVENNINDMEGNVVNPEFAMGEFPDSVYTWMFKERIERSRVDLQGEGFPYTLGWWPNGVSKGTFIWPLPFDLKPMNKNIWAAGDDGYPLGDLNWFGPEVVAAWENGDQSPVVIETDIKNIKSSDLNLKNFPNPFSSSTKITYNLPVQGRVILKVFNTSGAEVNTLIDANQSAGYHELNLSGANLSNGLYYYRIQVGEFSQVQKMSVIK